MADQVIRERQGSSAVAWIALLIAIVALIIAWMAYERTGADLERQIQTQVQQGLEAAENATREAGDAIDAGPDGVDEDDTDVNTTR